MCMKNVFRRFGAFVAALVLCFALSVPALADSVLSGTAVMRYGYVPTGWDSMTALDNRDLVSGSSNNYFQIADFKIGGAGAWSYVSLPDSLVPSGSAVGVYLATYYYSNKAANQNHAPSSADFYVSFKDVSTNSYKTSPVNSVSLFAPSSSQNSLSDGASIIFRLNNSASSPISSVFLYNQASNGLPSWTFVTDGYAECYIYVTSFRVVSTTSSAELDALESMAAEIANQSQILSQFYGDIVAVCNQIYQRLGDLQAAQEEANALFTNVIKLLNTTNGKLEAINMAMSTYFELLINQLKQEGIDTRTAIADAEARLELYLKPMIDYFNELEEQTGESASTLPQHKQDIDGFNNDGFGIEADGQTGLTAILPIFTAFSFILSVLGIFVGLGVLKIIIKKGLS